MWLLHLDFRLQSLRSPIKIPTATIVNTLAELLPTNWVQKVSPPASTAASKSSLHQALGAPANGAADVEVGIQAATAGEHERGQPFELRVGLVDFGFELLDIGRGDGGLFWAGVAGTGRQDGAEVE